MRFLCSTFGSAGDVFPMLGLASELQRRGHEVVFSTNEYYEPYVREQGLSFIAVGSKERFVECTRHPDLWHPRRAFGHIFRSMWPVIRDQHALHCEFARAKNSYAIANCLCYGALLAQETHRLPLITLHVQPAVIWSDLRPPSFPGIVGPRWWKRWIFRFGERWLLDRTACPQLNRFRAELGLAPISRLMSWWHSPFGVLAMFPSWYAEPQHDWPKPLIQTDFPLWNHGSNTAMPSEIEDFLRAGPPPIAFTPGSANLHGRRFFAAGVEACRRLNVRAVLLTDFPEQLPAELPKSMLAVRYVPLDLLLPKCRAFVHHGGIGSTSQGILAGIPQILMPMAHDQFDNGVRIVNLKLGGFIPATVFNADRLSKLLLRVLDSADIEAHCRETAKRLSGRNGLQLSADAIETFSKNG